MITKIIGMCMVMIASVKIGFDTAKTFTSRTKAISVLIRVLNGLKGEIAFKKAPLYEALELLGQMHEAELFSLTAGYIMDGTDPPGAFQKAVQELPEPVYQRGELQALSELFLLIGHGDVVTELNQIDFTIQKLTECYEQAKEKEVKYVRLCRAFGILGGSLLSLLFL